MTRSLTAALGAVLLLGVIGFAFYIHVLSSRAESMLRSAYELSEQSQPPTLDELQKRYGDYLKLHGCAASDCSYTVTLSNRLLAALRLVPYTELKSYLRLRDGLVITNMVDYTTLVDRQYTVVAHVQTDFCDTCQAFAIHPWIGASPFETNGLVEIGVKTPASSRRAVLSLNTRCLTRSGCVSVADLLPTVWMKTADKRIACRIQTDKGWVEKPVGWP